MKVRKLTVKYFHEFYISVFKYTIKMLEEVGLEIILRKGFPCKNLEKVRRDFGSMKAKICSDKNITTCWKEIDVAEEQKTE